MSVTVTDCVAVAVIPAESVALQITVVIPTGKFAGALLLTDKEFPAESVALAVPMVTLVNGPMASAVTAEGADMLGGTAALTVTF